MKVLPLRMEAEVVARLDEARERLGLSKPSAGRIVCTKPPPGTQQPAFTGCADDEMGGMWWGGARFELGWASGEANPKSLEWQYIEWVYLAGGLIHPVGGKFGDVIDHEILAPASPATSNAGRSVQRAC